MSADGSQDSKQAIEVQSYQKMFEMINQMINIYVTNCPQTGCSINVPVTSPSAPKHLESAAPVDSIVWIDPVTLCMGLRTGVLPLRITRKKEYGSSLLPSIVIPVMGPTGSGKTTFINNASNAKLPVGRGPEPCTNDIQPVTFELDRHIITLIDTPGLDGNPRNDVEILQLVTTYLSTMYRYGAKLGGVIYLRRIPDPRSDASHSSFGRFKQWCNDRSRQNVVIATNTWRSETGLAQKQELASDNKTFKLDSGPMLFKIYNTTESAHQLLRQLTNGQSNILQPFLLTIAVLGNTESGKTTFINRACNAGLPAGDGPEARTTDIQHAIFHLDGRMIVLLDTPGIRDTQSGAEIPQRISTWLGNVYEDDTRLSGVIYLHKVADLLPQGDFQWILEQFSKLCEVKNSKIAIVPNMWRKTDWELKSTQEHYLESHDRYVKAVLDNGAKIVPHDDTPKSAHEVIRKLLRSR